MSKRGKYSEQSILFLIPSLRFFEVALLDDSVLFAAPEEPAMSSYGLRPFIRIGIVLLGSRGAGYE
jgi:hypothetical protein